MARAAKFSLLLACSLVAAVSLAETATVPAGGEAANRLPAPPDQGGDSGASPPGSTEGGRENADERGGSNGNGATAGLSALPTKLPDGTPLVLPPDGRWVLVDKSERQMVVSAPGFREVFRIALGWAPDGDKEVEGDGRTPEGDLYVCKRFLSDRFHRFLGLSYPGPDDAARGAAAGLLLPAERRAILRAHRHRRRPPWNTQLGGNVGIHGWGRRRNIEELHDVGKDWTDGCIGVTNEEIERIYDHVRLGTRVVIVP